jgi:iron complex transport system substrate-binding protein
MMKINFVNLPKFSVITMKKIIIILLIFSGISSCKTDQKSKIQVNISDSSDTLVKYAKGFDIKLFNNIVKLNILTPYPNAKEELTYYLIPKKNKVPDSLKDKIIIRTPVKRIVATSTTHIPMIELFHQENTLVGFPQTGYISSKKTADLVKKGKVKDLGNTRDINTEILIELSPEVVIGFSLSSNNKMYYNIENVGIPVIYNGDWLEETPLGRAEWIKLFGALYDKTNEADSIFKHIESEYNHAAELALKAVKRPTVLSGVLFKDKWNLPAGKSFTARLFKDANTNYLWKDNDGRGSLVLSFESVFAKAYNADFWIGAGIYTSYNEMKESDEHYTGFKAFRNKNIYTFSKKRGADGGVIYFELSPIQPHFVLKDLIKVTHPELLPDYKTHFLEKLDD